MSKHLLIGSAAALILAVSAGAAYAQTSANAQPAAVETAEPAAEQKALPVTAEPAAEQEAPAEDAGIAMPLDCIPAESGLAADSAIPEDGYTGTYVFPGEKGESVYSIMDGTVDFAGWYYDWGLIVSIAHTDGTYSFYAHLDGADVDAGDTVAKGQRIGTLGCSGHTVYNALVFFRSTVSRPCGAAEDKGAVFSDKSAYDPIPDGFYGYQTSNDGKPDGYITDTDGNVSTCYH